MDASLVCGDISRGDLIYLTRGLVGEVIAFWAQPSHGFDVIVLEYIPYGYETASRTWRPRAGTAYVDVNDVVATLVWVDAGGNKARVILPSFL